MELVSQFLDGTSVTGVASGVGVRSDVEGNLSDGLGSLARGAVTGEASDSAALEREASGSLSSCGDVDNTSENDASCVRPGTS